MNDGRAICIMLLEVRVPASSGENLQPFFSRPELGGSMIFIWKQTQECYEVKCKILRDFLVKPELVEPAVLWIPPLPALFCSHPCAVRKSSFQNALPACWGPLPFTSRLQTTERLSRFAVCCLDGFPSLLTSPFHCAGRAGHWQEGLGQGFPMSNVKIHTHETAALAGQGFHSFSIK